MLELEWIIGVVAVVVAYNGFFCADFQNLRQAGAPVGAPVRLGLLAADLPWTRPEGVPLCSCSRHTRAVIDLHCGRVKLLILYFIIIVVAVHIAAVSAAIVNRGCIVAGRISLRACTKYRSVIVHSDWQVNFDFIETDHICSSV